MPVSVAVFLSPWCQLPLLLSAMFHPPSPPSPGSLHPSAPRLLPLDDDGRYDGHDGGGLGHLVTHLLLLDTDTSIMCKGQEKKRERKKWLGIKTEQKKLKRLVQKIELRFRSSKLENLEYVLKY